LPDDPAVKFPRVSKLNVPESVKVPVVPVVTPAAVRPGVVVIKGLDTGPALVLIIERKRLLAAL
jgi:hypothetical protein